MQRRLDLALAASQNETHFSLSHCPLASGFAIAKTPVGIDLEVLQRIRQPIVDRISSPQELAACPVYQMLWVAKEAAFKALNKTYGLHVMSEPRIFAWKVEGDRTKFSVNLPSVPQLRGEGWVQIQDDLILGIYVHTS